MDPRVLISVVPFPVTDGVAEAGYWGARQRGAPGMPDKLGASHSQEEGWRFGHSN